MSWYLAVLKRYEIFFSGRARRSEYWYFTLFNLVVVFILGAIDIFTGTFRLDTGMGLLSSIYISLVLVAGLGVAVRRLHDTGRSGWWLLIFLIPVIGCVVLLVFTVQKSQPGENKYGPNPKGE